jgi:hypothetical protein
MDGDRARLGPSVAVVAASLLLSACAGHLFHSESDRAADSDINAYPANYKSDILAAMHAYLNDPTGIHNAAVSAPMLKSVSGPTHYIVCLQFNAKTDNGANSGPKQVAAVFLAGRFDNFIEQPAATKACAEAAYEPFPELENLKQ